MSLPVRSLDQSTPSPEHSPLYPHQNLPNSNAISDQTPLTITTTNEDVIMSSPLSSVPSSPYSGPTKKRSASEEFESTPTKKATKCAAAEDACTSPTAKAVSTKQTAKKAPAKPKASPMPAKDRPRRNVKAPPRFEDEIYKEPPKSTNKLFSKVFDPVYVTTNSQSRLVKADVYHLLCLNTAWTILSPSEQNTILAMLPKTTTNKASRSNIAAGAQSVARPKELSKCDIFRTDVAKFQTDLSLGHLAKTWQAEAQLAMIERAEGKFDAWKAKEAERWWGENA